MRALRVLILLAWLSLLPGCGYIHFGHYPPGNPGAGNAAMGQAYSNLVTEHKILKQELALTRKEGDALRAAMEGSSRGASSPELVAQLNESTRELATLRASYARLQSERGTSPGDPAAPARFSELEEKLASSLRNYTQIQEENARLRTDLARTHAENSTLAEQLKASLAQNEQAQSALSQLNTELLAQKDARARAEQAAAAGRAQLSAVPAARPGAEAPALTGARESTATSVAALQLGAAPPAELPTRAELRTNAERIRTTPPPATSGPTRRVHVVQPGDTLEKIARKYYGTPERWSRIYAANNDLLRDGRPLKPGIELEIPE